MISLRKYLNEQPEDKAVEEPPSGSPVAEYRALLLAIGDCSERAIAELGPELKRKTVAFGRRLSGSAGVAELQSTTALVRTELDNWADRAAAIQSEHQIEMKE